MGSSSLPSGVYLNPVCTTASALAHAASRPSTASGFVDHYAILQLDNWATSEEIKDAYRRLRGEYFRSDAAKYRALQAAFDVLADREARWDYDREYRARKGLPEPAPLGAGAQAQTQVQAQRNGGRGRGHVHVHGVAKAGSEALHDFAAMAVDADIEKLEMAVQVLAVRDAHDANWGLKRYSVGKSAKSLLGTRPYPSFVPILQVYDGRIKHPELTCTRPRYVGGMARMALPA
ncbi:hypothetical protein K491DRAFT_778473 [Lophiostoma macrostomum CBS 122681]|uniref:J domain-containing protein n=1 Tax=Lophiostoma macrostomum CBS 122681 TaxID=1314788 RepID=A0A6A6TA66_9PLEO|nr:hypothetical protein K491DRAFT_778473 [Lophiostoma macrostomum CBS 122681]